MENAIKKDTKRYNMRNETIKNCVDNNGYCSCVCRKEKWMTEKVSRLIKNYNYSKGEAALLGL